MIALLWTHELLPAPILVAEEDVGTHVDLRKYGLTGDVNGFTHMFCSKYDVFSQPDQGDAMPHEDPFSKKDIVLEIGEYCFVQEYPSRPYRQFRKEQDSFGNTYWKGSGKYDTTSLIGLLVTECRRCTQEARGRK